MPKYEVINEFIDKETGQVISKGSTFEASGKRLAELTAAGVIGDEATDPPADTSWSDDKPLESLKKPALVKIATELQIDGAEDKTIAQLIEAIQAKRQASGGE